MARLNSSKFDKLIEQLLNKMINEENTDDSPSFHNSEGKTIINFSHNNNGFILLILYLLNHYQQTVKFAKNSNNSEHQFNDEEIEDLIQTVENLQQKNKKFQVKINNLLSKSE